MKRILTIILFISTVMFTYGQNKDAQDVKFFRRGDFFSADNLYIDSNRYLLDSTLMRSVDKYDSIFPFLDKCYVESTLYPFRYHDKPYSITWMLIDDKIYVADISYYGSKSLNSTKQDGYDVLTKLSGGKVEKINPKQTIKDAPGIGQLGLIPATWVDGVFFAKQMPSNDVNVIDSFASYGDNPKKKNVAYYSWLLTEPWTILTFKNGQLINTSEITPGVSLNFILQSNKR